MAAIRNPDVSSATGVLVPPEQELRKLAKPAKRPVDAPPAWTLLNHTVYSLRGLREEIARHVADGVQSLHTYYLDHRLDPTQDPDAVLLRQGDDLVIRYPDHDVVASIGTLRLDDWVYVYGIWPKGHVSRGNLRVEVNLRLAPPVLGSGYFAPSGLWGDGVADPKFDVRAILKCGSHPTADAALAVLDALVEAARQNEQLVIAELRRTMGTLEPVGPPQTWAVTSHWLDLVRKTDKDAKLEVMHLRRVDKKHVGQMLAARENSEKWRKAHVLGREESRELSALARSVIEGLEGGNDEDLIMSSFNDKTRGAFEALKKQLASLPPKEREAFNASPFSSRFPNRKDIIAGLKAALESGARWKRFHLEAKLEHTFGEGHRLVMRCEKELREWKVVALAVQPSAND